MSARDNGHPTFGSLDGPVVVVGFGSIGRGTLPLILRHFDVKPEAIVVVAPDTANDALVHEMGVRKLTAALTPENYRSLLSPLLRPGHGRPFCVNLSVDTSSVAILALCRELGALYVDTVIEPWPGFYDDPAAPLAARTNYALRQTLLADATHTRAGRPLSPPAEPTPGWSRGSSSRRCSTSPTGSA